MFVIEHNQFQAACLPRVFLLELSLHFCLGLLSALGVGRVAQRDLILSSWYAKLLFKKKCS